MSSNAYDKTSGLLHQIAGIPKSILNTLIAKTDAALNNQASSIEPTTTATSAHLVGEYIIYGLSRKYAKVTSAIAIGNTIVNGVNVDDITQGEVLTQLDSALTMQEYTITAATKYSDIVNLLDISKRPYAVLEHKTNGNKTILQLTGLYSTSTKIDFSGFVDDYVSKSVTLFYTVVIRSADTVITNRNIQDNFNASGTPSFTDYSIKMYY